MTDLDTDAPLTDKELDREYSGQKIAQLVDDDTRQAMLLEMAGETKKRLGEIRAMLWGIAFLLALCAGKLLGLF